ncbi:hypothetical protein DFH09DRAFT_1134140 [Mycena vulgaris]|nr:hypothetical protein DFH09DRAFT_1134140 [Mycena vulgaris]
MATSDCTSFLVRSSTTPKRGADDSDLDREAKRPKRDPSSVTGIDIFDDPENEKSITDLLTCIDGSGYVLGTIQREWPHPTKTKLMMQNLYADQNFDFEVEFSGPCNDALQKAGLQFEANQTILLSLKGLRLNYKRTFVPTISTTTKLKYPDGVVLAILSKGQTPERKIDTWLETKRAELVDSMEVDMDHSPEAPSSSSADNYLSTPIESSALPPGPLNHIGNSTRSVIAPRQPSSSNFVHPTLKENAPTYPSAAPSAKAHPPGGRRLLQPESSKDGPSPQVHQMSTTPESNPTFAYAPKLQTPEAFTLLSNVTEHKKLYSVIGVVKSITEPSKTPVGHWSRCLWIVDPSNCAESKKSLVVNCFNEKDKKWLPVATKGDIVILHQIKAGPSTAIGYHGKLQWATYNTLTGIGHGATGPPAFGFSPFYEHKPAELDYCVALHDWFSEISDTPDQS